jgi:hypothetical protein
MALDDHRHGYEPIRHHPGLRLHFHVLDHGADGAGGRGLSLLAGTESGDICRFVAIASGRSAGIGGHRRRDRDRFRGRLGACPILRYRERFGAILGRNVGEVVRVVADAGVVPPHEDIRLRGSADPRDEQRHAEQSGETHRAAWLIIE